MFTPEGKQRVAAAVEETAKRTSAAIVVSVHRSSGSYRHADYLGGAIATVLALCLFLFHPEPFDYTFLPLELAFAFAAGAIVTSAFSPLRSLLAGSKARERNVHVAARAAFVELGVGHGEERSGVLVFVSTFEHAVEVVADIGIDVAELGTTWTDAVKLVDRAVTRERDLERFVRALSGLSDALATTHPIEARSEDRAAEAHPPEEGPAPEASPEEEGTT